MRTFRSFSYKDTNLRVASDCFDLVTRTILAQRKELERYIRLHPLFQSSLESIPLLDSAPTIARRMSAAAYITGLGPMASVAGTLAQFGVEAALDAGYKEAIVENGGDMFIASDSSVTIGIYAGGNDIGTNLAFDLQPEELPLAVCSSSSRMGHSLSFGSCDLATVVAKEAALADSAATLVCNRIRSVQDIETVLNEVGTLGGIRGILAVNNGKIGIWGDLPRLVRNMDVDTTSKITRDSRSDFKG